MDSKYTSMCAAVCHMPDAGGAVGAGRYPALAKDPTLVSRQFMALTILMGRRNMPAFGARHAIGFGGPPAVLSDAQIASVINYVRSHFGNHYKEPDHGSRGQRARSESVTPGHVGFAVPGSSLWGVTNP